MEPARLKEIENVLVLDLVQAMLGLISPSVRAVAIEVAPPEVRVHFALSKLDAAEREVVEDIIGDVDALLDDAIVPADWVLRPVVHVGHADASWAGCDARRVFEARAARADEAVTITLTPDETVVFFEWLAEFNERTDVVFADQAEQRVLWNIECMLESILVHPFAENYDEIVAAARARVRDPEE